MCKHVCASELCVCVCVSRCTCTHVCMYTKNPGVNFKHRFSDATCIVFDLGFLIGFELVISWAGWRVNSSDKPASAHPELGLIACATTLNSLNIFRGSNVSPPALIACNGAIAIAWQMLP